MKLKNLIQDLIETKQIEVEPQGGNKDFKIYTDPMPDHGKGKAKETNYTKVNHTYDPNVIFFLEEVVLVVTIKGTNVECGVTTQGGKVTITGPSPSSSKAPPKQKPNPDGYSVLEQLNKMPVQIYILDLLRISPTHKEILENALSASTVPKDIDASQFQAIIGHIATPHSLKFTDTNLPSQASHNCALHLEVWIQSTKVKRVLVDGGAGLNICSLKFLKGLGISEESIEKGKGITIRAYDDQERVSQGTIQLPIQVGLAIMDVTCQVLDLDLPYNILLGCPWIHDMQVVASTYHQCVKFPYGNQEIKFHGDPKPFFYCKNLEAKFYKMPHVSKNDEGPSSTYIDPSMLASTSETKIPTIPNFSDIKAIIHNHGSGAYSMPTDKHMLGELPQSPKSYSMPTFIPSTSHTFMVAPTTFKRWGDLS